MERTGIEPVTSGLQSREVLKTAENEWRREALDPAQPYGLAPDVSHCRAEHEFGVFGSFWRLAVTSL
jgi:hypothetical protein